MAFINLDLHKYPSAIRFKFLELLGIKQKTVLAPKKEFRLNLVEHFRDKDRDGLKKRTRWLSALDGSEGNVVSDAAEHYHLTSGRRLHQMLKFHNSTVFVAVVLNAIETKTKGTYNLEYGILAGRRAIVEKAQRKVNGQDVVYVGKTFATNEHPRSGSGILIECETFNVTFDQREEAFDVSAWAPRFMDISHKKPQTIDEVERQAIRDHCFQAKVIDKSGKTHYLPGKSGEEFPSK